MQEVRFMVDDHMERLYSSTHQNSESAKPEVVEENENLAAASEHQINMDPTISKIIKANNLPYLKAYGGLEAVSKPLKTDLDKGLAQNEAIHHNENHAYSRILTGARKFSYLVLEASINKTILLLLLIATLSLGFGIVEEGLENGWFDGVILLIAIAVIVLFTCISKYMQELREQKKLDKQLSADGKLVHVDGQGLELDYGSKSSVIDKNNPLLSHGERVINGDSRMVITSTNVNVGWLGMMSKSTYSNNTLNIEAQLDKLYTRIHITGLIICLVTLIVLFFRYLDGKMDEDNDYRPESIEEPTRTRIFANTFRKIITETKYRALIRLLSVSLVGVTEGVPLVISLAIRNHNHVMLSGRAAKQDSLDVVNMASVTRICMDTFGGFSENEMEIDKVFIGGELISEGTTLPSNVVEALCDGFGTSKEKVFLHWAKDKFGFKTERVLNRWEILKTKGTNQFEEPCSVLMMGTEKGDMFLHLNGPSKEILNMCKHYYDSSGHKTPMDNIVRRSLDQTNENMLNTHLRTVAFACKHTDTVAVHEDNLVLIALRGLKNKNKEATKAQVKACREHGIKTVIVSSKKEAVLRDIALQSGVITNSDSKPRVITGEVFRKFTSKERLEKVNKIHVLGEATPCDKLLLVKTLREKGKVVAFLGQRTDEAPALKEADIGIAIGTSSCIKERENFDIIIPGGSFSDLISMADSGRYIYQNIQSFLQLFLITATSSTLINLLGTTAFGDAPLTTFELVWVNLAVAFLGGYVLLTKPSTDKQLVSPSPKRFLITSNMTKNILSQVLYAATYVVILQAMSKKSIISYSFSLCQFFNLFNSRELERKNFFKGINQHKQFWVAATIILVLQIGLVKVQVFLGYGATLNLKLWELCFLIGFGSWMVDWLGKVLRSDHQVCHES